MRDVDLGGRTCIDCGNNMHTHCALSTQGFNKLNYKCYVCVHGKKTDISVVDMSNSVLKREEVKSVVAKTEVYKEALTLSVKCYDDFNPKGIGGNTHSTKSFIAGFVAYVFYKKVLNLSHFSRMLKDNESQEQLWFFLQDVNTNLSNNSYFKKHEMKNTVYSWSNSLKRKRKEGNLQENVIVLLDLVDFEWSKKKEQASIDTTCESPKKDGDNDFVTEELFSDENNDDEDKEHEEEVNEEKVENNEKKESKYPNRPKRNNPVGYSQSNKKLMYMV